MDIFTLAAEKIIEEQSKIMGPLALDQAKKVSGLKIVDKNHITVSGNGKDVIAKLVSQYEKLFGKASIEVCKDAIREIDPPIPTADLPENLR